MRHLPPLTAVRVFESAARHENFTRAAAELGMTQAAVSYQIKLLEERLNIPLFRREKRRVTLTDPGRRLAAEVGRAFDTLDGAFASLRAEDEGALTLTSSYTFANTWLAWRLGSFQMANPETAVRLLTDDSLADFASEEVDIGVRTGMGEWPGLCSDLLFQVFFTPMCSPAFLDRHGGSLGAEDLLRVPRIGPEDPWWAVWLREAGVTIPDETPRGIRLGYQAHEGHAAMAGQGMAMLTPFFWRNDIAEGRLICPFDQLSSRGWGYWLVYAEQRRNVPKIKRFRDWLLAEVKRDLVALRAMMPTARLELATELAPRRSA
jgi:LysR family glycine cleavage system transcriptional activator